MAYLQTGVIHFAPPTTLSLSMNTTPPNPPDDPGCFGALWLQAHAQRNKTRDAAGETSQRQASPKSIYRLADKLGLDDLKEQAKTAYIASLRPEVRVLVTLCLSRLFG